MGLGGATDPSKASPIHRSRVEIPLASPRLRGKTRIGGAVELRTKRLLIREFLESDFDQVHAYAQDPEVCRYMPWGPNDVAATKAYLDLVLSQQRDEKRDAYEMAICHLTDPGFVIGGVGMRLKSETDRSADLGYILRRSEWGKGIVTEAATALLNHGFSAFNRHRIWATADVDNIGSQKVLEKIGMQREGRLRDKTNLRGEFRDSFLYARLSTDT